MALALVYTDSLGRTYHRRPVVERFLDHVLMHPMGGCWVWTGSTNLHGYGQLNAGTTGASPLIAHRWAYENWVGPVPAGLELDHLCRNRRCVFPGHLEPVTHRENILRGSAPAALHARKTHCPRGHAYSGRASDGRRVCGQCGKRVVSPL